MIYTCMLTWNVIKYNNNKVLRHIPLYTCSEFDKKKFIGCVSVLCMDDEYICILCMKYTHRSVFCLLHGTLHNIFWLYICICITFFYCAISCVFFFKLKVSYYLNGIVHVGSVQLLVNLANYYKVMHRITYVVYIFHSVSYMYIQYTYIHTYINSILRTHCSFPQRHRTLPHTHTHLNRFVPFL